MDCIPKRNEYDAAMDTQQLLAFIAVTETGSFSTAADRLHLTQPAVSKRIALLEEQLETSLFNRIGRHVSLTHTGEALLPRARKVIQEVLDARRAIEDLNGNIRGKLSIATSHHIGLHRLPPYLRRFSQRCPDVKLDLHFLDSEIAYQEILQGRFDLAVITLAQEEDPRIVTKVIWMDELVFVASKNHPLSARESVQFDDLIRYQAIMPDAGTYTTRLIKALFDERNQPLEINMVTNHLDTIKMMIAVGLGWGVLPATMVDGELHILPIQHPPLTRSLGCIHHCYRSLNNAARAFLDELQILC